MHQLPVCQIKNILKFRVMFSTSGSGHICGSWTHFYGSIYICVSYIFVPKHKKKEKEKKKRKNKNVFFMKEKSWKFHDWLAIVQPYFIVLFCFCVFLLKKRVVWTNVLEAVLFFIFYFFCFCQMFTFFHVLCPLYVNIPTFQRPRAVAAILEWTQRADVYIILRLLENSTNST